ncbi:MAG: mannonate dehydratase [Cellulomonas sp. 73-145]|uniref:mannonate dehydratase n=1 Tax=Cellulomonas sp. 73-145 TaxID=1895739 RepID=UPI00092AA230|nr:mannonate dehydratase [Cellulomonas sp. 73-145]MBN9326285.1 mannonate dehydratase [Cellulomonas sp.]OJV59618.1 MAG: mannonate dehydratase [Cellulomonas sp. 73-145]
MKMGFRWYGEGNDTVSLDDIRQIPGVQTVVWSLHHKQAGEVWEEAEIAAEIATITGLTDEHRSRGVTKTLDAEVVESVNVHESIKLGTTVLGMSRDEAIANYVTTIERLGRAGVKVVCYNFMPVFDWLRTDLFHPLPDGSTALFYDQKVVDGLTPEKLIADMAAGTGALTMPGWEPERLAHFAELNEAYQGVTHGDMYAHYKYFLDAVIPTCEEYDVKLGVHPDDPAFDLFGWPRVVSTKDDLATVLSLNDSVYNGLTLCLGSFSSNPEAAAVDAVRTFMDRIHFTHVRNIKHLPGGSFTEVGHRASEGSVDTIGIMKAYAEAGFTGYVRPDHGRHLWDENTTRRPRPGYGLYDRALGTQYLLGLWDAFRS